MAETELIDETGRVVFRGTQSPGGGSVPWDEHDLASDSGSWTDDGVGTWTFLAGVISQTDATADSLLQSGTALPSIEYVIEAEIRVPTGQDSGTTGLAVIAAGNQDVVIQSESGTGFLLGEGAALVADAAGDAGVLGVVGWVDGNKVGGGALATPVTRDVWHTLRAVTSGTRQVFYLDGTYVGCNEHLTGGNDFDATIPTVPDLPMIGAVGLVDFRNVKVWTRPVPA